jgi:tRNA-dihydrouridine synthase C
MEGVTDGPLRALLCGIAGGASGISQCVTEFVRVTQEPVSAATLLRLCPELRSGGHTPTGVPVFVQLLGGNAAALAASAALAADLGAVGIDLNFGCPAKIVNGHDGGAVLLKTPCRVETIVGAVRGAVPARIPVTAKVRLGWADPAGLPEVARAAEAGGASWLTVHARTREQGYAPPVDWRAVASAREAVRIPVVANGDVFDAAGLARCAAESGCHDFMIGRGVLATPDLFRRVRGLPPVDDPDLVASSILAYAHALTQEGIPSRSVLGRVKQWLRLGAVAHPVVRARFDLAKTCQELRDALAIVGDQALQRNA